MSGRPLRVVGLDLSLTSTGMSDGQSIQAVQTSSAQSTEGRLDHIWAACMDYTLSPSEWADGGPHGTRADLVVIEGIAFGAKGSAKDRLAGLHWIIRTGLWRRDIPFTIITPTELKLYTTGKGTASKTEMVAALATRHGLDLSMHKVTHGKYDMADAYALAAMGYHWFHQPLTARAELPERPELTFPARAAEDMIPLSVGSPLR